MTLPEITLPDGTPAFSGGGHDIELGEMYADIPMRTGHARKRRVYTTVPRVVSVKLDMTLAQTLAFHEWYEGPLNVGVEEFSAQVANQGPGLLWWRARFVEPYTAEADESGQSFWVTAKLRLIGEGSVIGPYRPEMYSGIDMAFTGTATIILPIDMGAGVVVELLPVFDLGAAIALAFLSQRDGAEPSDLEVDLRWSWDGYPYAYSRNSDVTESQELNQRTWMRI